MTAPPTQEGKIAYDAPGAGKPAETWYKIIGDLQSNPTVPPLIGLHGGPGSGHEYLVVLADVLQAHGIPIILYDQIGCGRSTHFQERMGDAAFWSFDLFVGELDNLIDHLDLRERGFHLLGHSWGGVLAANYAARQPRGLKKLVIASGPASIPLFEQGLRRLLASLPADIREKIEECERKGDYESPEYEKAASVFYGRHVCRLDPFPDEVMAAFKNLREDPTSYMTMLVTPHHQDTRAILHTSLGSASWLYLQWA